MNSFQIEIPKKDHPMLIGVTQREGDSSNTFDLFYNEEVCGCIFCNEHNVWIYEPHHHAGLLLDESEVQHLGDQIAQQRN